MRSIETEKPSSRMLLITSIIFFTLKGNREKNDCGGLWIISTHKSSTKCKIHIYLEKCWPLIATITNNQNHVKRLLSVLSLVETSVTDIVNNLSWISFGSLFPYSFSDNLVYFEGKKRHIPRIKNTCLQFLYFWCTCSRLDNVDQYMIFLL